MGLEDTPILFLSVSSIGFKIHLVRDVQINAEKRSPTAHLGETEVGRKLSSWCEPCNPQGPNARAGAHPKLVTGWEIAQPQEVFFPEKMLKNGEKPGDREKGRNMSKLLAIHSISDATALEWEAKKIKEQGRDDPETLSNQQPAFPRSKALIPPLWGQLGVQLCPTLAPEGCKVTNTKVEQHRLSHGKCS